MKKLKRYFALLAAMLLLFAAVPALANSLPLWLKVYVKNAPDDLEMTAMARRTGETQYIEAKAEEDGSYYFDYPSFETDDLTLIVRTGGREYSFDITANMLRYGADLDFSHGEPKLIERTELMNYLPMALACLGVTLAIEGIMLFIFGYRKPRSYIVFLITNVITQAVLHALYLTTTLTYLTYMFTFGLVLVELGITAIEAASYCLFFREHTRGRAIAYAIAANLASPFLGGVILIIIF